LICSLFPIIISVSPAASFSSLWGLIIICPSVLFMVTTEHPLNSRILLFLNDWPHSLESPFNSKVCTFNVSSSGFAMFWYLMIS
jgi:hypothetical protein